MIAGLYLGEVFRLVLCEMIDAGDLFLGQSTYKLEKPFAFDTAYLSLLEAYVSFPRPGDRPLPLSPPETCTLDADTPAARSLSSRPPSPSRRSSPTVATRPTRV